jgi:hypothetical protein
MTNIFRLSRLALVTLAAAVGAFALTGAQQALRPAAAQAAAPTVPPAPPVFVGHGSGTRHPARELARKAPRRKSSHSTRARAADFQIGNMDFIPENLKYEPCHGWMVGMSIRNELTLDSQGSEGVYDVGEVYDYASRTWKVANHWVKAEYGYMWSGTYWEIVNVKSPGPYVYIFYERNGYVFKGYDVARYETMICNPVFN